MLPLEKSAEHLLVGAVCELILPSHLRGSTCTSIVCVTCGATSISCCLFQGAPAG